MTSSSALRWMELSRYSACDVADALLKLKVPGAGFLVDIAPISNPNTPSSKSPSKVIAPISTILMIPKSTPSFPSSQNRITGEEEDRFLPPSNIQPGVPYADLVPPNTIVLISQPPHQSCAVVGGIMATRMHHLSAKAVIVSGRVRDLSTLSKLSSTMPIWSRGTSIIGAGAETKVHAMGLKIEIGEVLIEDGDIGMVDEEEKGVVVVPKGRVEEVLGLLPRLVEADERVLRDVEGGGSVKEAFAKHRT